MKTTKKLAAMLLIISLTLGSCMVTKTNVGQYRETEGNTYVYAKGKQLWAFWGILPIGYTNVSTPSSGNCQVMTKRTFGDILITTLTAGIISSYTIKIKAKREQSK